MVILVKISGASYAITTVNVSTAPAKLNSRVHTSPIPIRRYPAIDADAAGYPSWGTLFPETVCFAVDCQVGSDRVVNTMGVGYLLALVSGIDAL